MRRATAATAALGAALASYPLLLAPPAIALPCAGASGVALLAALAFRRAALATAAALLVGLGYGVALLAGGVALDAFAALFGTGWLLLVEGLFARCAGEPALDAPARRRRALYTTAVAVGACVAAHAALLAAALAVPQTTWTPLVPLACTAAALVAVVGLAARALGRPPP